MSKKFLLVICTLMIFIYGCDPVTHYIGENPELSTVATNSLLGVRSVQLTELLILESDSYGRTLFFYATDSPAVSSSRMCGILICQKSDKRYAYYYPDVNVLALKKTFAIDYTKAKESCWMGINQLYSESDIESFKSNNDWEKSLDESKLEKALITRYNLGERKGLVSQDKLEEAYNQFLSAENVTKDTCSIYLTSDNFNRHIWYFREYIRWRGYGRSFVAMFSKDGALIDYVEIKDAFNYQDDLKEFKAKNGWNNPVE